MKAMRERFKAGWRAAGYNLATGALAALVLAASPALAQETPGTMSFEVLDVTTASGSKTRKDNSAVMIEIMDLAPGNPEEAARAARAEAEADPGLTRAQREAKAREAALETALELWRGRTLSDYTYDIAALEDPFMPIREVRGRTPPPPDSSYSGDTGSLPPLLRLELNQLKLVAITTLTGPGSALASFEDGAGASYILKRGDRIGRRQGRITGITPDTVTVKEEAPPRVTDIRLSPAEAGGPARLDGREYEALVISPEDAARE